MPLQWSLIQCMFEIIEMNENCSLEPTCWDNYYSLLSYQFYQREHIHRSDTHNSLFAEACMPANVQTAHTPESVWRGGFQKCSKQLHRPLLSVEFCQFFVDKIWKEEEYSVLDRNYFHTHRWHTCCAKKSNKVWCVAEQKRIYISRPNKFQLTIVQFVKDI